MGELCGIGTDIADVGRFSRLWAERGVRFAEKWFSSSEIGDCERMPQPGRLLAERFAVKEAVWKALGPDSWSEPLPWREIATERTTARAELLVTLTGRIAAHTEGALRIRATVSSTAAVATAFAVITRA